MKWAEMLMLLSHVSHTPLPDIWRMTWRQIAEYSQALPEVVKITSPWPSGDKTDEAGSDPDQIRLIAKTMGLYKPNA